MRRRTFIAATWLGWDRTGPLQDHATSALLLHCAASSRTWAGAWGGGARHRHRPPAAHRGGERFALCSTFKLLLAAQAPHRVHQGWLPRAAHRLRPGRPARLHLGDAARRRRRGLTVAELCEAAMAWRDNTAANLLLARQGGPQALTDWLRTLGDPATRLDRNEPALNDVPRATCATPPCLEAMARTLQAVVSARCSSPLARTAGAGCAAAARATSACAGMPPGWRIGENRHRPAWNEQRRRCAVASWPRAGGAGLLPSPAARPMAHGAMPPLPRWGAA